MLYPPELRGHQSRDDHRLRLAPSPLGVKDLPPGVSGFGSQVSDSDPSPFERSFKCFLLINLFNRIPDFSGNSGLDAHPRHDQWVRK